MVSHADLDRQWQGDMEVIAASEKAGSDLPTGITSNTILRARHVKGPNGFMSGVSRTDMLSTRSLKANTVGASTTPSLS
jgi:hypothetical protein